MIRINFLVEGQTEETFVNNVLRPHFHETRCALVCARRLTTRLDRGKKFRGGYSSYEKLRNDLSKWMKEDKAPNLCYTSMVDLYGLKNDFPGMHASKQALTPRERVRVLEKAFEQDIADSRFVPYIQLFELEALILTAPEKLSLLFPHREKAIRDLINDCARFNSPEEINDEPSSSPSRRILARVPEYKKTSDGVLLITQEIGLDHLRQKCSHFHEWLIRLEERCKSTLAG